MPEEEKKEDDKIILQVDMHCEGCRSKVRKALKEFRGVEGLSILIQDQKVIINGKLDARQVYETVKKKSGRRTVLLYPDLQKVAEDEKKDKTDEPPPPEPEVIIVLKVSMHCAACAKQIRKSLLKIDGVTGAKEDFAECTMTVTGKKLDPNSLCARVKRRSGKYCEVVPPPPPAKEEEKKEDTTPAEDVKDDEKPAGKARKEEEKSAAALASEDAKPEVENPEEKKDDEKETAAEEKRDVNTEEKKDDVPEDTKELKRYAYVSYRSTPPQYYVYPPQIFSDENPNACSIM